MMAIGPDPETPSTTEDVPSAPGWVEQSVDEIFASLPQQPSLARLRNDYLDCLAGTRGPVDLDAAHDRCRRTLLEGLRERERLGDQVLATLEQQLEALEASITDRI